MNTVSTPDGRPASPSSTLRPPSQVVTLVLAWTAVGLPLAWGVAETLRKALALFQ
jgi:hypothetical protein